MQQLLFPHWLRAASNHCQSRFTNLIGSQWEEMRGVWREGWPWKTLLSARRLAEWKSHLKYPLANDRRGGEKKKLLEKIKSHYYFSQVKQLVYDSLHLCLVFNKATLVMYLFDVLAPSSLLCLSFSHSFPKFISAEPFKAFM